MAVGALASRPLLARQSAAVSQRCAPSTVTLPVLCRPQLQGALLRMQPVRRQRQRNSDAVIRMQPMAVSSAAAAAGGDAAAPAPGVPRLLARVVAVALLVWRTALAKLAAVAASTNQLEVDSEGVNAGIKDNVRNMRRLMAVVPFAALSNSTVHTLILITRAVSSFIKLYLLLLFMRVLLSWFPAFNWEDQPWLALRQVTDPYLNLFRGLVPPLLGTIDFTPLFGFMILQFLAGVLEVPDDENVW